VGDIASEVLPVVVVVLLRPHMAVPAEALHRRMPLAPGPGVSR
jgi:hypothetical protein